jgi:hypothetical protein
LEKQKIEFERREEEFRVLSNANLQLKEAKEKYESEFRSKLSNEETKNKQLIADLHAKFSKQEQETSEKLRDYLFKEKEFDKEIALSRQKIENLEGMLAEARIKDKDLEGKFASLKEEASAQMKDLLARSEGEKRGLNQIISDLKDKISDFEVINKKKKNLLLN